MRVSSYRLLNVTFAVCIIIAFFFCARLLKSSKTDVSDRRQVKSVSVPVIVWWTSFTGLPDTKRRCGDVQCYFTEDREFKDRPETKAFLFYGSNFDYRDLPLPRRGRDVTWALFHEESPKNAPVLAHEDLLSLFNFSSTFSRFSDCPLTLQHLGSLESITDTTYFVNTQAKNRLLSELSPVLYVQSDCDTPSNRDDYVRELKKYVDVDSFGDCLKNKQFPEGLSGFEKRDDVEFYKFSSRYKFTVAFENAVCEDYVTEKLWRPLFLGSVPVYMGSPTVREWLPNNNSAVLTSDFRSPKDLAAYIRHLNEHDDEYESYLRHKLGREEERITNELLIKTFKSRGWDAGNSWNDENFIERFECFTCKKLHENVASESIVDMKHYNCPLPRLTLTPAEDRWRDVIWYVGGCEAKSVKKFVDEGATQISERAFRESVLELCPKLIHQLHF